METPAGNLANGMQWLQATFTNRYNRVRKQAGHGSIFQGRYKALVVEAGSPLGMVCDYIHLNRVRAGIVPVESLAEWHWSTYRWLRAKGDRPKWLHAETALTAPDHCGPRLPRSEKIPGVPQRAPEIPPTTAAASIPTQPERCPRIGGN